MPPEWLLRTVTEEDTAFLKAVYASTRTGELALTDWDAARQDAFVDMQFTAQDRYYREHYPGAQFWVIMADGAPAGRLYLHYRPQEVRIMDIALLPAFRGQGVGSALLRQIQAEGQAKGLAVTIHVEQFNPARALYERLGFVFKEERGMYLFMEWRPEDLK